MNVAELPDAASLWQVAGDFLSRDPANNTHQLSALKRILELGARHGERFFSVSSGNDLAGCATVVDAKGLFLSVMADDAAGALGDYLREQDVALAGVIGRRGTLSAFTPAYGRDYEVHVELLLYQLYGAPVFGGAAGASRVATASDLPLLIDWHRAFELEVHMIDVPTPLEERVARRVRDEQIVLWTDNNEPVSFAGGNGLPASSARIGPVYTPPTLRGRGFAQAVTAAASVHVQRDQPRTVFLFTDASNPASNVCYQRIGYRHVADHAHLLFT
jgi:predicted GNAT family acetyltransferase